MTRTPSHPGAARHDEAARPLPFWWRVDETSSTRGPAIRRSPSWRRSPTGRSRPERRVALEEQVAASPELADRLAEQRRAVAYARTAAEQIEAPSELRTRIEAQRSSRRRGRPAVSPSPALRCRCLVVAVGVGSPCWARAAPPSASCGACPTDLAPGCRRRRDAHEDVLRVANRSPCDRASPSRRVALLRGLVAECVRRARAGRDLQRRHRRDALVGRVAEGIHHADGHARTKRRRSGLVRREGARRHGRVGD